MKYFLSISILLTSFSGITMHAQINDTIKEKVREEYSFERLIKNSITLNPASYAGARKYSITNFNVFTEKSNTPNQLQQKGKGKNLWGAEVYSLQKLDDQTSVWGNASYTQGKNKQMVWNENSDYDLIYPYVAADSVGGDMKFEDYSFSGGYSRKIDTYTLGITGSYQATLSYRDADPRPKNTAAHFSLAMGANKLMFQKFKIGAYVNAEKYTQKHNLSFVSNQEYPMIYNMSGLGNYNELLSGKLRQAYYEGWSYGGGLQIFEADNRNWYLNISLKKFNLDKLLTEYADLNASKIDEQQVSFSAGKFFDSGKTVWGISAEGNSTERKGTENLFLNENSRNYIQIGSVEKYNHKINSIIFKGLIQLGNEKAKSSFIPFFGWNQEKEKYNSPLSKIELSKIMYGTDYQWIKTFENLQTLSVVAGFSATNVYQKDALFNNSGKLSINAMLQENYAFQSSDFWQAKLDIHFHFSFPVVKNAFVGGKMMYSNFKNGSNTLFAVSIGSIF
ncbi:hypothetical protein BOQ62_01035 [Chryseobacterium sp. CH21]|uniref:DUF6850 family outer membrane beta-barrel protein n=1 Tax=Chryseobacterium sp. CH21 TaxID=713556 RepID=UPI00100B1C6E|nr:DUF6850 family outer membrane beta-barrel protein [Chryseobacterium sp. CH21]RXM41387.1 hypothetical protein BOQ62_01035 [Chryseobacterium sp. CH21]